MWKAVQEGGGVPREMRERGPNNETDSNSNSTTQTDDWN